MSSKTDFKKSIANAVDYNEIAKKVLELVPLYYDKTRIWYKYNTKEYYWEKVDEIEILNAIQKELELANISQNNIKNQLLNALQMESRKKQPIELDKNEIQFYDTIINIKTGNNKPATPEQFTFNPIKWKLGNNEETPKIDEILTQWVGINNVKTIKEWIAYNMIQHYPIHRVACFTGGGSNGKSTLIKLMRHIIGKHNIIAGELDTVFLERFGLSYLYRKTGIVMGETNFNKLSKTGKFKSATGEDPIPIEFKGKDGFDYINYAKVTICTNSLPVTEDKTDGFYRRWLIVHFPNKFTEKKDPLLEIPEEEYNNFCKQSIKILKELLERGKFTNEGDIEQRREHYERVSNPLDVFLGEEICENPDQHMLKKDFAIIFREWQRKNHYRVLSDAEIGKQMKQKYDVGWRYNKDGLQERAWLGICKKTEALNTCIDIIKPIEIMVKL